MKARYNVIQVQIVFTTNMVEQPIRRVFTSYDGLRKLSQCCNF